MCLRWWHLLLRRLGESSSCFSQSGPHAVRKLIKIYTQPTEPSNSSCVLVGFPSKNVPHKKPRNLPGTRGGCLPANELRPQACDRRSVRDCHLRLGSERLEVRKHHLEDSPATGQSSRTRL